MEELWQLFSEQGTPLEGQAATKNDVFANGLLHGAAHVWTWRTNGTTLEVLLQKRAATKRTWPNRLDISVAGHIDAGETPLTTALREAKEEIGTSLEATQLEEIGRFKTYMRAENGAIENEFQWLYLFETPPGLNFILQEEEVASLTWKKLSDFETEFSKEAYVPHPKEYYLKVIDAIKAHA